jgi:hypothetical protein
MLSSPFLNQLFCRHKNRQIIKVVVPASADKEGQLLCEEQRSIRLPLVAQQYECLDCGKNLGFLPIYRDFIELKLPHSRVQEKKILKMKESA